MRFFAALFFLVSIACLGIFSFRWGRLVEREKELKEATKSWKRNGILAVLFGFLSLYSVLCIEYANRGLPAVPPLAEGVTYEVLALSNRHALLKEEDGVVRFYETDLVTETTPRTFFLRAGKVYAAHESKKPVAPSD